MSVALTPVERGILACGASYGLRSWKIVYPWNSLFLPDRVNLGEVWKCALQL